MISKIYLGNEYYERKLMNVMKRLGAYKYSYDYLDGCRKGHAWIRFVYNGETYELQHSKGLEAKTSALAFTDLVLCLEGLARAIEQGIYDVPTWFKSFGVPMEKPPYLRPPTELPPYFKLLGFDHIPETEDEIWKRYEELVKEIENYKDARVREQALIELKEAVEKALEHMKNM